MMYFIAILTGIGIHGCMFIFFIYNSIRFNGSPSEKLQYYATANIPLLTAVMYSLLLIQYNGHIGDPLPIFLNYFFIEWVVTTPILIINISRILYIKLYKYFILSLLTAAMNVMGYVSNIVPRPAAFGAFGAGAACYLSVIAYITSIYYYRNAAIDSGLNGCIRSPHAHLTLRVIRYLLVGIFTLWSCYPIIYLLSLTQVITLDAAILPFVILDVLSKSILVCIILGYYDYLHRRDSFLQFLLHRLRVHPLQAPQPIRQLSVNQISSIIIPIQIDTPSSLPTEERRLDRMSTHSAPQVFGDL